MRVSVIEFITITKKEEKEKNKEGICLINVSVIKPFENLF